MVQSVPVSAPVASSRIVDPIQMRRLAIADALLQQSLGAGPVQSVPEGLAKVAQAGVAGYFANAAERRIEGRQKALADVLGQAAQAGQTGVKEFRNPDDPTQVLVPGAKPGMDAYISTLANSHNPDAAPYAANLVASQLQAKQSAAMQLTQALAGKGLAYDPAAGSVAPITGYAPAVADIAGQEAGAKENAIGKAKLGYEPQLAAATESAKTPALVDRAVATETATSPIKTQTAVNTATATAPIDVAKETQIAANRQGIQQTQNTVLTEKNLREEFNNNPIVKNRNEALTAYKSILDAKGRDTLASDLNIVYGFAKLMDPGSVVREGESVMVTKTGGIWDQVQGWINALNGGARLPPNVRDALVAEATGRMQQHEANYKAFRGSYENITRAYGGDPSRVLPEVPGGVPQGKPGAQAPAVQPGQKVSGDAVTSLPEGTVVTGSDGKDYAIRAGKLVPVTP